MRSFLSACVALSLCGGAAFAQTATSSTAVPSTTGTTRPPTMAPLAPAPMQPSTAMSAPSSPATMSQMSTSTTPKGDAKGANSFTENEARHRLENNGYSNVSALNKDQDGVWRGTATIGGTSKQVGVDYKGDISTH